jgi:agmatinase
MHIQTAASIPAPLGFAGAPLVDWQFLAESGQVGDLVFFGCDIEINRRYGDANPGAASFVRTSTALNDMALSGGYDLGIMTPTTPASAVGEIAATSARIIVGFGGLPVLIACDHTASLGALSGSMLGSGAAPVYLYFDAHFDLGRNCASDDLLHNGGFVGEILKQGWASQAINIGGRSRETTAAYPDTPNFVSIPAADDVMAIIARLAPLAGRAVHVSIDADVLDPSVAPNVACPEPDGMTADALLNCCRWIGRSCRVVGADLSEVLPVLNGRQSERLLMRCLQALSTGQFS